MWVKVDDGFFEHPKAQAAGPLARELAIASWCWASRHLTNGQLPANLPTTLCQTLGITPHQTPWAVDKLVKTGLWVPSAGGDGWEIHDYLDYNPSKDWFEQQREAGQKGARKRWGSPNGDREAHSEAHPKPHSRFFPSPNPPTPLVDNSRPLPPPPTDSQKEQTKPIIDAIRAQLTERGKMP